MRGSSLAAAGKSSITEISPIDEFRGEQLMFEIAEIKDVPGDADEYVVQMPIFEPDYLQSDRTAAGGWSRNRLAYALGDMTGMLTSSIAEQLTGPADLFTVAQVGGASEGGFARVELSR